VCEDNSIESISDIHRKFDLADPEKSNTFRRKKTHSLFAFAIAILVPGLVLPSCVSSKKLVASEARVNSLQIDNANAHGQLEKYKMQMENLNKDNKYLQNKNAMSQIDLETLASESNMTISEQAKQLRDFKGIIQSQNDILNELKNSIANALMSYKADELSVYMKHGKVYVSLQEKLLFKSGSDVVDPKGREALKTLAQVLKTTNDITVIIEGHTDNVPIKTNRLEDNWDLSTARATSIVRILTIDNNYDPNRITASGRSQYHPLKPNSTDEGRADNRRTEVVLSPDLEEIYKLLYR
jgi:chemotaxis protein MotB